MPWRKAGAKGSRVSENQVVPDTRPCGLATLAHLCHFLFEKHRRISVAYNNPPREVFRICGGAMQVSRDADHQTPNVPCAAWLDTREAPRQRGAAPVRGRPRIAGASRWRARMGRVRHVG